MDFTDRLQQNCAKFNKTLLKVEAIWIFFELFGWYKLKNSWNVAISFKIFSKKVFKLGSIMGMQSKKFNK